MPSIIYIRESDGKEVKMGAHIAKNPRLLKSAGLRVKKDIKPVAVFDAPKSEAAKAKEHEKAEMNTRDTINLLRDATTLTQINEIIEGEERKTILQFAEQRKNSLTK